MPAHAGEDGMGVNDPDCLQPEQATARKTLRIGAENNKNNGLLSFPSFSFLILFLSRACLGKLSILSIKDSPQLKQTPASFRFVSFRVTSCRVASLLSYPLFVLAGERPLLWRARRLRQALQ